MVQVVPACDKSRKVICRISWVISWDTWKHTERCGLWSGTAGFRFRSPIYFPRWAWASLSQSLLPHWPNVEDESVHLAVAASRFQPGSLMSKPWRSSLCQWKGWKKHRADKYARLVEKTDERMEDVCPAGGPAAHRGSRSDQLPRDEWTRVGAKCRRNAMEPINCFLFTVYSVHHHQHYERQTVLQEYDFHFKINIACIKASYRHQALCTSSVTFH